VISFICFDGCIEPGCDAESEGVSKESKERTEATLKDISTLQTRYSDGIKEGILTGQMAPMNPLWSWEEWVEAQKSL
jgi:hypothetical protein